MQMKHKLEILIMILLDEKNYQIQSRIEIKIEILKSYEMKWIVMGILCFTLLLNAK